MCTALKSTSPISVLLYLLNVVLLFVLTDATCLFCKKTCRDVKLSCIENLIKAMNVSPSINKCFYRLYQGYYVIQSNINQVSLLLCLFCLPAMAQRDKYDIDKHSTNSFRICLKTNGAPLL